LRLRKRLKKNLRRKNHEPSYEEEDASGQKGGLERPLSRIDPWSGGEAGNPIGKKGLEAMVRGGGRKPYRQKGTGRSRAGTIRSPLWRGGGVIFGPSPRDFGFSISKKVRKQALRIALSVRAGEGKLLVLNQFQLKEIKTKSFLEVLSRFGMEKALIVIGGENLNLERSARNVPGVKVLRVEGLNVYDILYHENLILLKDAVEKIQERLAS
jgi:large subunit ribosomal protein L4